MEKILRVAINNNEWNTVAHIMVILYAQFVEGDTKESMVLYNKYINKIDISCVIKIIDVTPFKYHATSLQSNLEERFDNDLNKSSTVVEYHSKDEVTNIERNFQEEAMDRLADHQADMMEQSLD